MGSVLAVAASARRNGNSDTLLEKALGPVREAGHTVETIIPYRLSITPCRSCHGCWETGRCVVDDEMQELYVKFCEADYLAVAAPVYFTNVPGHLKVLIDRFQCFWARTYRLGEPPEPRRRGIFLCVGGMDREAFYSCSLRVVKTWFSTLNVKCAVDRFYPGVDQKGAVDEREDYLEDARQAGRELISVSPEDQG